MSNLEKWIKAILNEDANNLSIGSVRTLQMIKHEFERLQKQEGNLQAELQTERAKSKGLAEALERAVQMAKIGAFLNDAEWEEVAIMDKLLSSYNKTP